MMHIKYILEPIFFLIIIIFNFSTKINWENEWRNLGCEDNIVCGYLAAFFV